MVLVLELELVGAIKHGSRRHSSSSSRRKEGRLWVG
jgi:hypothetical protein